MGTRQALHSLKLVVWAVLVPFFLLSAASNGLMLQKAPEGIAVVICSGEGPLELRLDVKTGEPVEKQSPDRPKHCDWASLHLSAALPDVAAAPDIATASLAAPALFPSTILTAGQATGLPPSTGPPAVI
ncbi:DUF2946 family protein [Celeribacter indicus]|uniref:DUF2946 domain-containing protein n=1 Tax=Celeribacter indicus TaxID=1208324 RepID=A0A0B5DWU4_9RHOB|nr:DUF2946 family protein [Celeribacter indicus]AJE45191.1 hypothetical protein P73_0476 [Celeribacter indicus]